MGYESCTSIGFQVLGKLRHLHTKHHLKKIKINKKRGSISAKVPCKAKGNYYTGF